MEKVLPFVKPESSRLIWTSVVTVKVMTALVIAASLDHSQKVEYSVRVTVPDEVTVTSAVLAAAPFATVNFSQVPPVCVNVRVSPVTALIAVTPPDVEQSTFSARLAA